MPKVIYTETQGLYQTTGTGIELTSDSLSFAALPTSPVQPIVAGATVTSPGVYTIAGGSPTTVVMPTAASVPGGVFVFRAASAQRHLLTGSLEVGGTKVFSDATNRGSELKFAAGVSIGDSVSLISDGKNFTVMSQSGSYGLAGA